LETRTGFLHPYQPLAVPAEAKARGIARQIGGFAAIQQRGILVLVVESPEVVQETCIWSLDSPTAARFRRYDSAIAIDGHCLCLST
jgi:environmental stress-induced protein Ves